ncbi:hypothetical protein MUU72_04390 [Streptomyces sp. RS10V-4]|uniref:SCO0607 family lipoprotein n=1 Tax=Streptomyces rhizoryzae TaxID=2932493 RepID=UPI002002D945|nr:hypothetical protein [Streptomyces rhizoryzae]MCK7622367.1 hypothetical protein [Streptomyces rhizoryzae]
MRIRPGRRHAPTARAAGPVGLRTVPVLVAAGAAAAAVLSGCSVRDAVCGNDAYPVQAVGSSGSACVPKDQDPPAGYVRYPAGKEPRHVDDKWYTFWNSHTIDKHGNIVKTSGAG